MGASLLSELASSAAPQSELRTRVISAIVLAPIAIVALAVGGILFAAVVVLVAIIGFWEWTAMSGALAPGWVRAACAICLAGGLIALAFASTKIAVALIVLPALLAIAMGYRQHSYLWIGLGIVYVGVPTAGFIVLRQAEPFGFVAVLYVLLIVWATDIAAFFGGRSFGGGKLWPRVSPKKTWSGALTGIAAAVVVGGIVVWLMQAGDVATGLVLAAPISVAAQGGDLLESAVKRRFGVKDSGSIIPGHGGVLDRVDALFGASALAWLIAALGLGGDILAMPQDIAALTGGA
jgi:phosphatidate cytidylyltransferase